MEQAILFTNYSNEDFSHTWDKVKYNFPAKQSIMLQESLARHFARHLSIRELNKKDKNTGGGALQKEMQNALSSAMLEAEDETKLQQKIINANVDAKAEKEKVITEAKEKGMEVDKRKSAETIKKELGEFEGLNQK